METSKKQSRTTVIIVFACITVGGAFVYRMNPNSKFEHAVQRIAADPRAQIGGQFDLSTYIDDQPLFFRSVTSKDINEKTVWAYHFLCANPEGNPTTYYAEIASMPTQETIWQYPEFFIRLYVTSALESDGATVGVFSGSYEAFRDGHIAANTETAQSGEFAPIKFAEPKRFLSRR